MKGIGVPVENVGVAATPVPDTTTSLWEHNSSIVLLEATGVGWKIVYEEPDADVPVKRGTLLFEGTKLGDTYSGTAYRFSRNCGSYKYDVKGPVSPDQSIMTLYGKAPILSGCKVSGYRDDVLVFRYLWQSSSTGDQGRVEEHTDCGAPHGPYRVTGLSENDVLNIRAGPGIDFAVVFGMPPSAEGIEVGPCIESGDWCKVRYQCFEGWAAAEYLQAGDVKP